MNIVQVYEFHIIKSTFVRLFKTSMTTTDNNIQPPATLLRRLGAMLYDLFLLLTVIFVASFVPVILFNVKPEDTYFFLYQVYIFVISYVFYAWFWIRGGQTLGMRTWKVKVVTNDGSKLNWSKSLIRYLVAILSLLALGLGFFWSLWDKQKRTWHDIASGTRLIKITDL